MNEGYRFTLFSRVSLYPQTIKQWEQNRRGEKIESFSHEKTLDLNVVHVVWHDTSNDDSLLSH